MAEANLVPESEPWGDDPKLVELLGRRARRAFVRCSTASPRRWAPGAVRDADGRIVDFTFGYGNPSILRAFRLPAATRDRYTLLEALPQMRGSRAFDAYVRVCESGEPWVHEVTYDTPFGDGYMLGTFVQRSAKLGDGLVNFLTDVTSQRRMEAELRSFADVVAHDLNEPIAGIALLVGLLERRAEEPPSADVLRQLRVSTDRARDLIDGVLVYARAGELSTERVALGRLMAEVAEDLRPSLEAPGRRSRSASCPKSRPTRGSCGGCCRTCSATPSSTAARRRRGWSSPPSRQPGMGRHHARQRTRHRPGQGEPDLRDVHARQRRDGRRRDRAGRLPPHRRGPRRADLGRGRPGRRPRLSLHPSPLTKSRRG